MSNKVHDPILEALRLHKYGKIHESVSPNVKRSIERFYKEQKTPSGVKKMINNILNYISLKANEFGDNKFTGGKFDFTKGDLEDNGSAESGPSPQLYPSVYEVSYQIKFLNAKLEAKDFYNVITKGIQKDMKENFKEYEQDGFSADISIDTKFSDGLGYAMSIEPSSFGIIVSVYNQVSPFVTEGGRPESVKVVKYYKGKQPWDNFEFKFTPFKNEKGEQCMQVYITNNYWDSHDYAFVKLSDMDIKSIYSYSDAAANKVRNALKTAKYTTKDLEDITKDLHISESATGIMGTEIGLPIDKENCEGTDVSGVATPTSTLNLETEDTDEEQITCPKCGSANVNVVSAIKFKCADCDTEWELEDDDKIKEKEKENKDGMLDNSEDEKPKYSKELQSNVNIYVDPIQGLHESKTIASSTQLKGKLEDAVCSVGDLEYIGNDYFEINVPKSNQKAVLDGIEKFLKKLYPTEKANNKLYITGGDEVHYMEVFVKKKVGNNDIYTISYNLPL